MFIKLLRKYIYRRSFVQSYAARRGFTLVELMIYLVILSLISVGIMQMILEVQTSNITVLSHADNFAKGDLALRRVQVKLGSSDDVEVVTVPGSPLDKACLRLKSYQQYERAGYRFDGRNQFLRTSDNPSDYFPILGASPRTISAWVRVDPDHAGRGTVVMWGNGQKSQFALDIEMVRQGTQMIAAPVLNFNCASMRPQQPKDLRDGTWHHIAVTFSASAAGKATAGTTKMYVDGVATPLNFVECLAKPGDVISTTQSPLYIGRDLADRQSGLKGVISDLRIWQRSLAATEIRDITGREPAADQNVSGLVARYPLASYSSGAIVNRGSWSAGGTAALFNAEGQSPVARTFADTTTYNSFCFFDIDNDGLHELWESDTSKTLPDLPFGTAAQLNAQGWRGRSDDIFVPGQVGFFKVVGRDPASVIANFAIGKGVLNRPDRQRKTESKALASTRVKKRPELCAISAIPPLASPNCRLTTAFIAIDDYVPGLHGELDMQFVSWQSSGSLKSASNLPNMPSNVTATWYQRIGVMKFSSPLPLETRLWNRVISQTLYRPKGQSQTSDSPQSSDATITFRFGIGGLPFFEGTSYSMHEFVEVSPPMSFDNATIAAQTSTGSICGMRSYLAAITSEAEQDHLEDVMISGSSGAWQSGWIGGVIRQGQTFAWETPPSPSPTPLWQGTGVAGHPYDLATGQRAPANAATLFEFDQKPGITGHRKRMLIRREGANSTRYRYTNWMGGNDTDSCDSRSGISAAIRGQLCEPLMTANGTAIAIHGHMNRDGTWVSMPGSTTTCDASQSHSVCGYYREFDTVGLSAGTVLGGKLTVNMERFREFCKGS